MKIKLRLIFLLSFFYSWSFIAHSQDTKIPESKKADEENLSAETVDINTIEEKKDEENKENKKTPETSDLESQDLISEDLLIEDISLKDENEKDKKESDEEDAEFTPAKTADDLESIKEDLRDEESLKDVARKEESSKSDEVKLSTPEIFDVGKEEKELLTLAQNIQGQISDGEWSEVATASKVSTYTVVKNDWLFKISKKLFGSGFYYPKIWSLNSYITNPHFIEPGMVLSFTTGSSSEAPEVKLGTFSDEEKKSDHLKSSQDPSDLKNFGEDSSPPWLTEKEKLQKQGVHFQYSSEQTIEDLAEASAKALNKEYENYEPPKPDFSVELPKNYDQSGFDKNSRIFYSVKEGFYLNTFLSTNIVQDFGSISDGPDENIIFTKTNRAYVKFEDSINPLPGDRFSIYTTGEKISNPHSDREGYQYSIIGQIQLITKIRNKWEVEFLDITGTPQRGDRITTYTPKIERITKTYNSRTIEAVIISSYQTSQTIISFGDVAYLDRGRADGLEMGNVLEVFGFKDRSNGKAITDLPTYKMGELTVITLTDNFATVLVTDSIRDFKSGDVAITKTKEAHLRDLKNKIQRTKGGDKSVEDKSLEELDVELNLENLNEDLLKQADKIQLTEDELAELERQEREKSILKESETDLKSLERLESDIEAAEKILNDARVGEDKLLEQENLDEMEKKTKLSGEDSLEEIEENLGKRYLDEDLNSKDNPFGLTEFDVEEIDELLNIEKKE